MYGIFTHIYHRNHPNVGKYTIHGSYGYSIYIYKYKYKYIYIYRCTLTLLPSKHPAGAWASRFRASSAKRVLLCLGRMDQEGANPTAMLWQPVFNFRENARFSCFSIAGISNVTEDTKRYKQNMYMSFTPVASFLDFHPCKLKTTYTLYKNNFQLQFSRPLLKGKCHLSHFRHIYALSTWACLQFLSVLINLKHHTERLKHAKTSRGADRRECLPPCVVPPRCPRWFRGKWRQVMGWSVGNGWQWEPTSSGNSRDGWKKKQPRPVSRNGDLQHVTSN